MSTDTLMTIADACRRRERLRLDCTDARGDGGVRDVEPHHLVSFGRRWYLIGFDTTGTAGARFGWIG